MISLEVINIAIITVKCIGYRHIIHDIKKSNGIHLLENFLLDGPGYIQNTTKKSILKVESASITLTI